jgi:hypothetical protein
MAFPQLRQLVRRRRNRSGSQAHSADDSPRRLGFTMTTPAYRTLIHAVCRHAGILDATAVERDGNLRVDDVDFTLLPVAHPDGELVLVYCDFGMPPVRRREQALQRLLELNLLLYGGEGPGFSFSRESGHVLFMVQMRLAKATVDAVLTVLRSTALFAHRWRTDHFLDDSSSASGATLAASVQREAAQSPFTRA